MKTKSLFILSILMIISFLSLKAEISQSLSYYRQKPHDPDAIYFSKENFNITSDGKTDVSDALQGAINKLKLENNIGIIFIPEGTYVISRTIYIPAAIRIIGYGQKRPLFVLRKNTPGYQLPVSADKGKANYMFWFTSSVPEPGKQVNDAGAGTFYSALINVDLKIEDGNPEAVALRTHFAQHSFVSHCDILIGKGKAGLFDIGNEMEDVRFFGGDYGIYTTKASPGWQFMMLDTYFEGQRKSAIKTQQAGLTIVRMTVKNVPEVISVDPNYWEKLYMEDCQLVNVSGSAISFDDENNANMQINLRNVVCQNVKVLVDFLKSKKQTVAPGPIYNVKRFIYGLQINDLNASPQIETTFDPEVLTKLPQPFLRTDLPALPPIENCVNLKELGAKGDGQTDDTKAIKDAIEKYPSIYVPQGIYRISENIKLKSNTVLIGLHPIATQIILGESSPVFSGFGAPVAMIEAPQGGTNIISGIGISTGEYNFRAVAFKWMAGEKSMIEDVKFVGGHGSMVKGPYVPWGGYGNQGKKPSPVPGADPAWDTQYWSLWITHGGGGTFKNIWTANTYATSGVYVSETTTPSRIYAMSVEHHVRNEVRFSNVSNWRVYALQLEEESREGSECQPMEISLCNNLIFANLYMFRVIRMKVPYPYSVRTWDCSNLEMLNVHNYSQIKYTTDNPLYDINTNTDVRPVEFARLFISGKTRAPATQIASIPKMLAQGFEFAEGLCSDSKGNVYFCEQRMKRIYKWSSETNSLTLLADYQWEPLSLACDSKDNLLVVFRYNPQFGLMINGEQEKFSNPPDASGTSFSAWGNSGFATLAYSIDPANPDETIQPLKKISMNAVKSVFKALYPSNRWRDSHDFDIISVKRNDECFVAPDGITIIPVCYDLARSCALIEAFPGKLLYASDEYEKRTVSIKVDSLGYLSDLKHFAENGEFSSIPDKSGNVYVADGDIYIFDKDGNQKGTIHVPERPSTVAIGGKDRSTLFITGRTALYSVSIK
jgi:sugar lactone lactonase YvrE